MKQILVTGGCGYIGAHTIVDLIENGYKVISVDNNSRSHASILEGIKKITGITVKNYKVDLCNFDETHAIFQENDSIDGIIHFAAYKAVGESVENPLDYYTNNLNSLINILRCATEFKIKNFVFSSSCTVYGNPTVIPVTENSPLQPAASPYGATKQMGEEIVKHAVAASTKMNASLLRYFNPVGAHASIAIGEISIGKPQNLVPAITQTAIGKLPQMKVWGSNYNTKDGTCIRDYIHVCDIAHAHTLAIKKLEKNTTNKSCDIYNLGSGNGFSVLELIKTFEKVSGVTLNYVLAEKRAGDVEAIYANNEKANKELNWYPKYDAEVMMQSAWEWEKKLKYDIKAEE
jgi:UDP-glucose 4-epimerase